MKLGIPIYQGVNLLDVAGPLEMFYWAGQSNDLQTVPVSADGDGVTSINGVSFKAHASFAQTPALDVLWVPGGDPDVLETIMKDPNSPYLQYLRQVAPGAKWVCSVCEGALLLARGAAGRACGDDALVLRRMPATFFRDQGGHHPPALRRVRQSADRRRHLRGP
jgi:putative intracellular protease/amidase